MTFGEKLQKLRREKGLSQDQLAEQLNVSRQAVSKWERGEALPDTDKVVRLSELFSVSIDYLLKEQPRPEPARSAGSDFFSRLGRLAKEKGYCLGYVLAGWGALDLLRILLMRLTWNSMIRLFGSVPDLGNTELQNVFNAPLTVLWPAVALGLFKIAGGVFVVIYGRRHRSGTEVTP